MFMKFGERGKFLAKEKKNAFDLLEVAHRVELKINFARVSRKEKSWRRVGLALLVFVGKRWAMRQRLTPDMML
jgi:hypothetical protein